jgi:hypothetical protein
VERHQADLLVEAGTRDPELDDRVAIGADAPGQVRPALEVGAGQASTVRLDLGLEIMDAMMREDAPASIARMYSAARPRARRRSAASG